MKNQKEINWEAMTISEKTIWACETETKIHNLKGDKHNAKADLTDHFNKLGVEVKDGVVITAHKPIVKAYQVEVAKEYFATGNITMETAEKKVREFVADYCGYRLRAPQKGRTKSANTGKVVRAKFNADKTIVVIDGVTYAKVK